MTDRDIAGRFNARFGAATRLLGGAAEPLYLPAREGRPALIRYTRDYARSALHEIAHWCLAAEPRRRRVDYGHWYLPPPRSAADQARFYRAEAPVQALEMALAEVCGLPFHFSADNPGADGGSARRDFETEVYARFRGLCRQAQRGELADDDTGSVLQALHPHWCERLHRALDGRASPA